MNLGQLITQARIELQDRAKPYLWDDDELTLYINEAEEEACIRKQLIRTALQIDVAQGERSYDLPAGLVEIVYASYITAGADGMLPWVIGITTAAEMDALVPYWRTLPARPTAIIHYDTTLEVNCNPNTDYTLNIEGYRLPSNQMVADNDTPEINAIHHRHLLKWVKHRAYQKHDVDSEDAVKSQRHLDEFDAHFGPRPDASNRKTQNANQPQHNTSW